MDHEKMINALHDIAEYFIACRKNVHSGGAAAKRYEIYIEATEEAAELLKAQEPRMLTLEEVRNEYKVVWLETKYLPSTVSIVDKGGSNADWLCLVFGLNDSYSLSCLSYGKKWRCWSSIPTYEQREAVKWKE